MFFSKDFIETAEGLIFAVVDQGTEHGKVLCFLRYIKDNPGWKKVTTEPANAFLKQHHPDYLHYSPVLDAHLHAVSVDRIAKHHRPKQRLQQIMQSSHGRLCRPIGHSGNAWPLRPLAGAACPRLLAPKEIFLRLNIRLHETGK